MHTYAARVPPALMFPAVAAERDARAVTRAISAFVIATPLLWPCGLLAPVGGLLVLWLALRASARVFVEPLMLVWLLVAAAQATSIVINGVAAERDAGFIAYRLVSSGVTGWILLGMVLTLGAYHRVAVPAVVRSVCILGGYFVLFGLAALLIHSTTGIRDLEFPTPPALLLPASLPAVKFTFTMRVFSTEDLLGRELPRLVLFYPWAVVLGFAGIAVFFIAQLERDISVRLIGSLGGLVAVVGSQGRAPILALLILIVTNIILQRGNRAVVALLAGSGFLLLGLLIPFGITPATLIHWLYDGFNALRPGSSMARELGYALSIAGFLQSPIFGQGWIGGYVTPDIPLPVGSHSSFYGLLYTGGVVTLGAFLIALGTTLVVLLRRARYGRVQQTGLLIVTALALLAYGEGIYSFVLPCIPLLLFVGGTSAVPAAPFPFGRNA